MRIVVTGCAGYIGTTLTPYLLRKGYDVRCVDWFIFGEDVISHFADRVEVVRQDVREISADILRGADAVVDMAAIPNDPAGELAPDLTWQINYKARANTAALAEKLGVARYILISSASVYGRQTKTADEDTPPNPLTTYAKANLEAEKAALSKTKTAPTVLRLSTVYGPSKKMRFDLVVNSMTLSAYKDGVIWVEGDGLQTRPLVHIVDVARAIAFILEQPTDVVRGQIYNVGSEDQNMSIIEIAKKVQSVVGGEIRHRGELDKRSYTLSFQKIRGLGWSPIYTVEEGIKQVYHALLLGLAPEDRWFTVKWYKKKLGIE